MVGAVKIKVKDESGHQKQDSQPLVELPVLVGDEGVRAHQNGADEGHQQEADISARLPGEVGALEELVPPEEDPHPELAPRVAVAHALRRDVVRFHEGGAAAPRYMDEEQVVLRIGPVLDQPRHRYRLFRLLCWAFLAKEVPPEGSTAIEGERRVG
jgi:hypothetical protein